MSSNIEYSIRIKGTYHSLCHKDTFEGPLMLDESNKFLSVEVDRLLQEYRRLDPEEGQPDVIVTAKKLWVFS